MEVVEVSMEEAVPMGVVEHSMGIVEASMKMVETWKLPRLWKLEASAVSMDAGSLRCFHESFDHFHESFRQFHGSFHCSNGSFYTSRQAFTSQWK